MKEGIFVNPRYKDMSNLAKLIYRVYSDYQKYGDNSFADEYGIQTKKYVIFWT